MRDNTCKYCDGSGYVNQTVRPKDIPTLLQAIAESIIPLFAERVKCPACRGRGYYRTTRPR